MNTHYEAVVRLSLLNSSGQTRDIDAVVDTGYNGRRDIFDTYGVTVFWDGQSRFIDADEADAAPLLGMSMLDNHDLSIQVRDGGRVVIQAGQ